MSLALWRPADDPTFPERLARAPRVAVDTEFHPEKTYAPTLLLVQLALDDGTIALVDPLDAESRRLVGAALAACPLWVVHAGDVDLPLLHAWTGAWPTATFDTQLASGLIETGWPRGLGRLLLAHLGVTVPKDATLSDWSARPLRPEQLAYAADDVRYLLALADALSRDLEAVGRSAMHAGACRERLTRAQTGDGEAWRGLLGSGVRDSAEANRLRVLWQWREGIARDANRPPRSLVADALLRQLAHQRPTTLADLEAARRWPRPQAKQFGEAWLSALSAADAMPESDHPAVALAGTASGQVDLWLRLRAEVGAAAESYSAPLVLPDALRAAIAGASCDAEVALGWREPLLAPWLRRDARASLRLELREDGRRTIVIDEG
jgi:ribonuclease D